MRYETPAVVMAGASWRVGTALGVARTLGRAGVPVYGVLEMPGSPLSRSRYVRDVVTAADTSDDAIVEALHQRAKTLPKPIALFPTSDKHVVLLAKRGDELEAEYVWSRNSLETIERCTDKGKAGALVQSLGIRAPATMSVGSTAELEALAANVSKPWIVKPASHCVMRDDHLERARMGDYLRAKALLVHDIDQLRRILEQAEGVQESLLVQEFIPGDDTQVYAPVCYVRPSGVSPVFVFQKLRQSPPGFGFGCHTVSVPDWHEDANLAEAAEMTVRFAQGAGFQGICGLEWKRHADNGLYYFIEANARIIQFNVLWAPAGCNLVLWSYVELTQGPQGEPPEPINVRRYYYYDELADPRSYAATYRGRGPWWLSYRRSLGRPLEGAFYARDDPLPGLFAIGRDVSETVGRKVRRLLGLRSNNVPANT
ncbi:MAG: hypothetical protein HPY69_01010 [Armatimonadetes bacterium]|nr:hypothetical protein [Armatimonadota bacterium]